MVSLKLLKSKHIYNFYRIKKEEEENHRNKKEITTKFDEEPRDISERYQNILVQGDYERTFGKHTVHLLAGFSQEWNENQTMNASRQDLVSDDLHVLNAGTEKFDNDGMGEEWALSFWFWKNQL